MKNAFISLLSLFTVFFIAATIYVRIPVTSKPQKEEVGYSCETTDLSGLLDPTQKLAYFEGSEVSVPELAMAQEATAVLGTNGENKWIEIDLSDQKLIAREGDGVFLESKISSGLPRTPTPTGEFRIWIKLRATRMQGGQGRYYYNLPNVPYVMYFSNSAVPGHKGYGIHGAYWHNDFGTPRSHGCVNLPIPVAERLYYWATPDIPGGKSSTKATGENPGTRIVIHQ